MTPDAINGCFEAGGAVMAWRNAWQLKTDGEVRGVYWPIYGFYSGWGVWNLFYYPALEQWFSFFAGVALVAGNLVWLALAVRLWVRRGRA